MAGPAGFEPTNDGVKVRCLTAWLWAYIFMGRLTGIEPASVGATIRCVSHFATTAMPYHYTIFLKNVKSLKNKTPKNSF